MTSEHRDAHTSSPKIILKDLSAHTTVSSTIYKVAQNKIPHQRICNISATSVLILKTLEVA